MNLLNVLIDVLMDLFEKLRGLLLDVLQAVGRLAGTGYEKFLDLSISEKVVFLNAVGAFLAVVMPVARYYIFETYFYINNPLAVYMIGIVFVMWGTLFFEGLVKFLVRMSVNGYYLIWILYLPLAGDLTKANPHSLSPGYYLNIAVPVVYMGASAYSFFIGKE